MTRIRLILRPRGPLALDGSAVRGSGGPKIEGHLLKAAMKAEFRRLRPGDYCVGEAACEKGGRACACCALFGKAGAGGALAFSAARLRIPEGIDPATAEAALFEERQFGVKKTSLPAWRPSMIGEIMFEAGIETGCADERMEAAFLEYLKALSALGLQVGKGRARGHGAFEVGFEILRPAREDADCPAAGRVASFMFELRTMGKLRVTPPLAEGWPRETLRHLTGAALRGSLERILPEAAFGCSNFYPSEGGIRGLPVPGTARCCPAFAEGRAGGHEVRDIAIEMFVWSSLREKGLCVAPSGRCRNCGAPLRTPERAFRIPAQEGAAFVEPAVVFDQRSDGRGRTVAGEWIDDDNRFAGWITTDDGFAKRIDGARLSLGAGTGEGRGGAVLRLTGERGRPDNLRERVRRFNDTMRETAKMVAGSFDLTVEEIMRLTGMEGRKMFSLTLLSPLLLPPGTSAEEHICAAMEEWSGCRVKLARATAGRGGRTGGFGGSGGLPRELSETVAEGSVFLFSAEEAAQVEPALERAETDGLGMGQAEGFGEASACDWFHTKFSR